MWVVQPGWGTIPRDCELSDESSKPKRNDLLTVVGVLSLLLLLASSLMYYAENDAQPDDFSSIPEAMWWGIITLTTVGYGDASPITAAGRALAGLMAVLGIGLFALPAGILGSGFIEEISESVAGRVKCAHTVGSN